MPCAVVRLLNRINQLLAGMILALALTSSVSATDVLVAGTRVDLAGLRAYATAWERATGHRISWLDDTEELVLETADILVVPWAQARALADQGSIMVLDAAPAAQLPPLLTTTAVLPDGQLMGLPLPVALPSLYVKQERLQQAGLGVPQLADWSDVFELATLLADPIGDVYGLCMTGYLHATIIRAMLAAAGEPWLNPDDGLPYSGSAWLARTADYAQQLARNGPPNSASLTYQEFTDLRARDKCATWLTAPESSVAPVGVVTVAVPGATAFATVNQLVLVVPMSSVRAAIAIELAHAIAQAAVAAQLARSPAWEQMYLQTGSAEYLRLGTDHEGNGWLAVDRAGEQSLRRLIDGLEPVASVLAASVEELKLGGR